LEEWGSALEAQGKDDCGWQQGALENQSLYLGRPLAGTSTEGEGNTHRPKKKQRIREEKAMIIASAQKVSLNSAIDVWNSLEELPHTKEGKKEVQNETDHA